MVTPDRKAFKVRQDRLGPPALHRLLPVLQDHKVKLGPPVLQARKGHRVKPDLKVTLDQLAQRRLLLVQQARLDHKV